MKRSRLLTAAVVAAVAVGGSTLIATGTANADTANPTAEWVNTPAQLTPTTRDRFTGTGWGIEDLSADPTTAVTFGASGLTADGSQPVVLGHVTDLPVSSLVSSVETSSIVATGVARPILEVKDADGDVVGLQATTSGSDALAGDATYASYQKVDGTSGYTAQTLQQWQDAFATGEPDATVIVYGAFLATPFTNPTLATPDLSAGDSLLPDATPSITYTPSTVSAIQFNGLTSYFTPTPSALTISPSTTTVSGFGTGVTVSGSGFFPGETVSTTYGTGQAGGVLPTTFVADANGDVSGTLPGPATITPLTYTLSLIGETSGIAEFTTLVVTADPAVVAPVATPVRATATFTG